MVGTYPKSCTSYCISINCFFACTKIHNVYISGILTNACNRKVAKKIINRCPCCRVKCNVGSFPQAPINTTYPNGFSGCIAKVFPNSPYPARCFTIARPCVTIASTNCIAVRATLYPAKWCSNI